jgi:hypothetical protein
MYSLHVNYLAVLVRAVLQWVLGWLGMGVVQERLDSYGLERWCEAV